jgi:hypothetical protein
MRGGDGHLIYIYIHNIIYKIEGGDGYLSFDLRTDGTDRRDGQTGRTDGTYRWDRQTGRTDGMDRRDGQTGWTDGTDRHTEVHIEVVPTYKNVSPPKYKRNRE